MIYRYRIAGTIYESDSQLGIAKQLRDSSFDPNSTIGKYMAETMVRLQVQTGRAYQAQPTAAEFLAALVDAGQAERIEDAQS
jgi:hypothetical protein